MKKLNKNDINHLLAGNSWFATGGGFPRGRALEMFTKILKTNSIHLKSLAEFDDNDMLCVASGVGSIKNTDIDITKNAALAIDILEKLIKTQIKGIISGETGLECIAAETAGQINVPLVDTDMKGGRAAPEPSINMFHLNDKVVTPFVAINTNEDIAVLLKTSDPQHVEIFLRNFANMANGTFVGWCPRLTKEFKGNLIDATITRSIQLGKELQSRKSVKEILTNRRGKIIFDGIINKIREKENKGFLIRKVSIKNRDNVCQIWIRNENLVATVNNKTVLTCPDLITLLDKNTGLGLHNNELRIGMFVLVIGLPVDSRWHTKQGHEIFSPKHFSLPFPVVKL